MVSITLDELNYPLACVSIRRGIVLVSSEGYSQPGRLECQKPWISVIPISTGVYAEVGVGRVPRPKKCRWVCREPSVTFFKPRGIPLMVLDRVSLAVEELEAVRLKDLEGLDQEEAAATMNVSQPTFHRILESAHKKIADALVRGKAIKIEGGEYVIKRRARQGRRPRRA
jgi:predicted DNA-binding protein (UPF0251 family)